MSKIKTSEAVSLLLMMMLPWLYKVIKFRQSCSHSYAIRDCHCIVYFAGLNNTHPQNKNSKEEHTYWEKWAKHHWQWPFIICKPAPSGTNIPYPLLFLNYPFLPFGWTMKNGIANIVWYFWTMVIFFIARIKLLSQAWLEDLALF